MLAAFQEAAEGKSGYEAKKAMGLTGVWNKIRRSDEKRTKDMVKSHA